MIKIKNLEKRYANKIVFSNLNYEFENGLYKICGSNGRGKSVLFRLLAQIENKYSGTVINSEKKSPILFLTNSGIGIPFLSIYDNINLAAKLIGIKVYKNNYINLFGNVEDYLNKSYESSSLGNQMKVGLSLLFSDTKFGLILLDEALNGLDLDSQKMITNRLIYLSKETSILLVSHNEIFGMEKNVFQNVSIESMESR